MQQCWILKNIVECDFVLFVYFFSIAFSLTNSFHTGFVLLWEFFSTTFLHFFCDNFYFAILFTNPKNVTYFMQNVIKSHY